MSMRTSAQFVSFVTLPLWIPLFISFSFRHTSAVLWASASCFVLLALIFFYKNIGLLTSLHMPTRAERLLPLATSIVMYILFAVLCYFYAKNMFPVYILAFFTVLGLYVVNLWDKVSIHVAGITAGVLWFMQFYVWNVFTICIGLLLVLCVVWARLYLKAHTVKQIVAGFVTGVISYGISLLIPVNL